jgi:NAD(P)-dependent dehydrogenase (short-subunit alcohol dehydrogenase family)
MNVTLAGKTTIVTGAASGIGLAVVRKYLEAGADGVIAVDVVPDSHAA